jgi:hypothetical protein
MPTKREREYYAMGFRDGVRQERAYGFTGKQQDRPFFGEEELTIRAETRGRTSAYAPKKRKLSAWNKYVKANSKKPRFRYRNGKLNLKKMAVAFRKTPQGKKKRR